MSTDDTGYISTGLTPTKGGDFSLEASEAAAKLSRCLIEFYKDLFGRGPTGVKTALSPELATVAMHEVLTVGEQTLVAGGKASEVEKMRLRTADIMRPQLIELAEESLGVAITTSVTGIRAADNLITEAFILAPGAASATD